MKNIMAGQLIMMRSNKPIKKLQKEDLSTIYKLSAIKKGLTYEQ